MSITHQAEECYIQALFRFGAENQWPRGAIRINWRGRLSRIIFPGVSFLVQSLPLVFWQMPSAFLEEGAFLSTRPASSMIAVKAMPADRKNKCFFCICAGLMGGTKVVRGMLQIS